MHKIYELETKNGRIFRVAVTNKNQEKRLKNEIANNKNKTYEVFTRIEVVQNGIHDIKQFENICKELV